MPSRVQCPRCKRTGLVRSERVIRGSDASTEFFCGACLHEWALPDEPRRDDDRTADANSEQ